MVKLRIASYSMKVCAFGYITYSVRSSWLRGVRPISLLIFKLVLSIKKGRRVRERLCEDFGFIKGTDDYARHRRTATASSTCGLQSVRAQQAQASLLPLLQEPRRRMDTEYIYRVDLQM